MRQGAFMKAIVIFVFAPLALPNSFNQMGDRIGGIVLPQPFILVIP